MEAIWPGGEGGSGRVLVAGAELDHMAAAEGVCPVARGEPVGALLGDEVGAQAGAVIGEGAANDLLHLAVVEVDAGPEPGHGGGR